MIKSLPILEKKKILFFIIVLVLIVLPAVYVHAEGLVPSCNTGAINATTGQYENPCNFNTVMGLINKMIDFLLFYFATPLAALAICYAGFKLLTAGGSPEQMTKAKHIIRNVIIGYILALGAWLIVHTIFSTLGFKGNTFLKDQDIAKTEVAPQPVTTSLPQPISQETKKDDSGVLFIGGSYTEENPNGDTCNNPDSKPLPGSGNYTDPNNYNYPNFNSYLGPTKVYAGELTEESKKVQQVRLRASEFRIARCWLVGIQIDIYTIVKLEMNLIK